MLRGRTRDGCLPQVLDDVQVTVSAHGDLRSNLPRATVTHPTTGFINRELPGIEIIVCAMARVVWKGENLWPIAPHGTKILLRHVGSPKGAVITCQANHNKGLGK